jgi:hypothetical protein
MNPVTEFLARCDAVAKRRNIKRSTLSTMLFRDGKRLGQLADGKSDVGVLRLEAAKKALAELDCDRSEAA